MFYALWNSQRIKVSLSKELTQREAIESTNVKLNTAFVPLNHFTWNHPLRAFLLASSFLNPPSPLSLFWDRSSCSQGWPWTCCGAKKDPELLTRLEFTQVSTTSPSVYSNGVGVEINIKFMLEMLSTQQDVSPELQGADFWSDRSIQTNFSLFLSNWRDIPEGDKEGWEINFQ